MANEQKSLWDLASDIFTDYEGTITEATFQFNEYGGQARLTFDEIDGRDNPTWENYDLPPGWESPDGGETIQRIAGDGKGIIKSSKWGRFLAAAGSCDGARDALGEDAPINANAWIGTRWRMEAVAGKPYKFKDKETGEMVEGVAKDKNYPVEFLGKDSASAPASTNGHKTEVDSLSVLFTINDPIVQEKIKELAKQLPHKDWFGQSYTLLGEAGITPASHPDLITAMGGRELYESLGGKG